MLVSLNDDLDKLDKDLDPEILELRKALQRAQKQLQQQKQRTDELVEATIQASHDAVLGFGKITNVPEPMTDKRKSRPEVALWHLTDWQGAKRTSSYNSKIMHTRVMEF